MALTDSGLPVTVALVVSWLVLMLPAVARGPSRRLPQRHGAVRVERRETFRGARPALREGGRPGSAQ